jgi:3-hydroxyacyl-CoA dehydrogenase
MAQRIRRAAVIGSGVMGAAIAAHLTNAGIPTLLLDIVPKDAPAQGAERYAIVKAGLEKASKAKPAPFMSRDRAALVSVGNLEDDLARLGEVDWIIEAAVENLDIKRKLWENVEKHAHPNAIISSNSSGIPMSLQIEGRSQAFRERFIGAHFFNPPRYLFLLELIPTKDTKPEIIEELKSFGDRVLGKGIVIANDVPGFVANRVGVFSLMHAVRVMFDMKLTPDTVDALTGPLIGRPKSATFRTADISGLDVLTSVAGNLAKATGEDFAIPAPVLQMAEKGLLGEKTKAGFFKSTRDESGKRAILTLNFDTFEYENKGKVKIAEIETIRGMESAADRMKALLALDNYVGEFMRRTTYPMMHYAASKVGVVADSFVEIDNGLKWGFGWELGPFEIFDILGVKEVAAVFEKEGMSVPAVVAERIKSGSNSFYDASKPRPRAEGVIILSDVRKNKASIVKTTSDASLVDIGDGVLLLEFHAKMNALGDGAVQMTQAALELVPKGFAGLVVGNQGENFSAGANLAMVLMAAQAKQWDMLDQAMIAFQGMTTSFKYAPFPVVAAPFNLALGGGCEVSIYCDAIQAHAELYMGLVEVGVGLLPAGGGTTDILIRFTDQLHPEAEPFEAVKRAFQLIATAKTSTSALEARELGFLNAKDRITMSRERVVADAKKRVLELAPGYVAPVKRSVRVLGEAAYANLSMAAWTMNEAKQITDYELHLARTIARVLSGGMQNYATVVSEDHLLALEREGFLKLAGEAKTQERIMATLTTGKPLRN